MFQVEGEIRRGAVGWDHSLSPEAPATYRGSNDVESPLAARILALFSDPRIDFLTVSSAADALGLYAAGLHDPAAAYAPLCRAGVLALRARDPARAWKPLARALYKAVEVDKMIPKEFYKAVAEIIFYLSQRQARIRPVG